MEAMGLDGCHIQASRHADVFRAKESCHKWDPAGVGASDFAISTAGLLALAIYWHHRDNRGAKETFDTASGASFAAAILVDLVVKGILGDEVLLIPLPFCDEGQLLKVDCGSVTLAAFCCNNAGYELIAKRTAASDDLNAPVPLRFMLSVLVDIILRPSRTRSVKPEAAREVLQVVLMEVGKQADLSRHEDRWSAQSCLASSPINGKQRSRRVSAGFNEALAQAVFDDPALGFVRNFLATSKVVGHQKSGGEPMKYSPTNSSAITKDTMFGYWLACRESHKGVTALHLSIDGVRCGGDETNVFIAYAPALGKASPPPPQAMTPRYVSVTSSR